MYVRDDLESKFRPWDGKCNGNCLDCAKGIGSGACGIEKLTTADGNDLSDYKKMKNPSKKPRKMKSIADFAK
jgi:hypothetical protein